MEEKVRLLGTLYRWFNVLSMSQHTVSHHLQRHDGQPRDELSLSPVSIVEVGEAFSMLVTNKMWYYLS
jgi:hypothetical protein